MTEVPVWRRDFPYEAEGEDEVTRREFVRFLSLGSGAFAVSTVPSRAGANGERTKTQCSAPVGTMLST